MKIIIHRGTHEVGGSCVEIQGSGTRIVIDIGMPLVNTVGEKFSIEDYKNLSGKDLVCKRILPDIRGLYSWNSENDKVDGILISHPHIDHYGLFGYLREDITYYIGDAAKHIIDMACIFTPTKGKIKNYVALEDNKQISIGDFKITSYLMDHSAYDSYAFLIEAEGKRIVYSGDFREHGRNIHSLGNFLKNVPEAVDALIIEGTVLGRINEAIKTEEQVENEVDKLVSRNKGITLINFSSQNIDRVVTMYQASKRNNKIFVMDFYTANILSLLERTLPHPCHAFPDIRVFYPFKLSQRMASEGHKELMYKFAKYKITKKQINENKDSIMMIVRASMLSDLKRIDVSDGLFIYSMWEGYLKEKSMEPLLNFIDDNNMNFQIVHTSGHASLDTLKKVINTINPKVIIPMHSFHPEDYKTLFTNVNILSDGEVYNL